MTTEAHATSAPIGGPWDTGGYPTTWPPVCSHGMPWASPCASCGRGYPAAPVVTVTPDPNTAAILLALGRIEALLIRLVEGGDDDGS